MWQVLNDLSVGRKLLVGFGLVVMLALGVAGAGFYSIFALFERGDLMTGVAESQIHLLRAKVAQQTYLHDGSTDTASRTEQSLHAVQSRLQALLDAHPQAEQRQALEDMKQGASEYQNLFAQLRARRIGQAADPRLVEALEHQADKLLTVAAAAYVAPGKEMAAFNQQIVALIGITSLVLLLVAGAAGLLLHRQIVLPLQHAVMALGLIAEGDLRAQIDIQRKDELGQLLASMRVMVRGLRSLVERIGGGVNELSSVASAFAEVSARAGGIAQRQSREAEQSSSALVQMAASVQEVAGNTQQASDAAREAEQQARSGAGMVAAAVGQIDCLADGVQATRASMVALARESERVGSVLDVIRSVAEQTNLLALNAAIEAARAGDQGRGFAVVADEVRALAMRSQGATMEIATTIESLQALAQQAMAHSEDCLMQARKAVEQTGRANDSLQAITSSISLIEQMNHRIAAAATQQSAVAEQVSRSVVLVRDEAEASVTNASDCERYSDALMCLSAELKQRVSRFQC